MEVITGNVDLEGIKRFQVPDAVVKIKCPKCGEVAEIELVDQIYYPGESANHSVCFECEKCDIEIERKIEIVSVIATFNVEDQQVV